MAYQYDSLPTQLDGKLGGKSGRGWRVFRRYRTRANGRFLMRYRFTQTRTPTTYVMRVQVRRTVGYPYLQGNSRTRRLRVLL